MSQLITILNQPPTFSPVYTDGLFFTVSTKTDFTKFRYVYEVYVDGQNVFTGKATPNPFGLGVIDVSKILKNYVSNLPISTWNTTPIYTHQTFPFSRPFNENVISYELKIGYEYASDETSPVTGFTGEGTIVYDFNTGLPIEYINEIGEPNVSTGTFKTFQSTMGVNGNATKQNFDIDPFVLDSQPVGTNPTTSGLFLTNSPRNRNIQPSEYYTLGFTNYYLDNSTVSEPYYVEYKFYDSDGNLIQTDQYQNILTNGGGPLPDCNAVYPSYYLIYPKNNTKFNTLYVGAGPVNIDNFPPNTAQYTVQLFGKFQGETSPIPPTPTPTPSSTPAAGPCGNGCRTYNLNNTSPFGECAYTYYDCTTRREVLNFLPPESQIQVCACTDSVDTECGTLVVTDEGPCGPQPCITCKELNIFNNTIDTVNFTYFDCYTQSWVDTSLPTSTGNIYCSCAGTVEADGALTIITGSTCGTPEPTPTPSCLFKTFVVQTCSGSGCESGICACTSTGTRYLYADCDVDNPYIEGVRVFTNTSRTLPFNGTFTDGTLIFNGTNGYISIYCVIGSSC